MSSELYSVVLSGRIAEGFDEQQVRRTLAGLFKTAEANVEKLFASAPVRIKKAVERDTALKYKAAVERAGALCELEPDGAQAQPQDPAPSAALPAAQAIRDAPEAAGTVVDSTTAGPAEAKQAGAHAGHDIYAPPAAALESQTEAVLRDPRRVAAGRGWSWIAEGFDSFRQHSLPWIGIIVVWAFLNALMSVIPLVSMALYVLHPMFVGGLMLGCFDQEQDRDLEFGHLFAGFSHQAGKLATVGGIYLGAMIGLFILVAIVVLIMLFALGVGMGQFEQAVSGEMQSVPPQVGIMMVIGMLGGVALGAAGGMLILMAIWFAPALIVLHDVEVSDALKLSFTGCLRNWVPFLVYGLVLSILLVLSALPFLLGLLVMGPVAAASIYKSYRDIYVA